MGLLNAHTLVVMRQGAGVVTDTSAFFTSDRFAVLTTLRVSFGFTYGAPVAKVHHDAVAAARLYS